MVITMEKENAPLIKILKGPDRVRKRPAVIFDSEGLNGSITAVKSLLDIFTAEAVRGHCSKIDVAIYKDNSISIQSYDRGLILDETIVDGKPAWQHAFCELYCAPREMNNNSLGYPYTELFGETEQPKYQVESNASFNLCCVQYASKFMHVEATRDGMKKTLEFEKGFNVSDIVKEQSSDKSNTFIHFLLDSDVFSNIIIPSSAINSLLQEIAITIPGIKCELHDKRDEMNYTFYYPYGVQDYVTEITTLSTPLYIKEIEATGKDRYNWRKYDARVKVLFSFVEDSPQVKCFHNFRIIPNGGYHLNAIKKQIEKYVNWHFLSDFCDDTKMEPQERCNTRKNLEFSFDELSKNIVLIIETNCSKHAIIYENATQKAFTNKMITDMASDLIDDDFRYYLKQNHDAILDILKIYKRR